jgi:hypothetical protein
VLKAQDQCAIDEKHPDGAWFIGIHHRAYPSAYDAFEAIKKLRARGDDSIYKIGYSPNAIVTEPANE